MIFVDWGIVHIGNFKIILAMLSPKEVDTNHYSVSCHWCQIDVHRCQVDDVQF